jgi:hypothetical protein
MITNLKIYILNIAIFIGLMFSSAGNAFGAKSMDASQAQVKPMDNFDSFPEYHREAQKNSDAEQAISIREEKKNETDGAIVAGAKWLGKLVPYEFLYGDYAGFMNRATR